MVFSSGLVPFSLIVYMRIQVGEKVNFHICWVRLPCRQQCKPALWHCHPTQLPQSAEQTRELDAATGPMAFTPGTIKCCWPACELLQNRIKYSWNISPFSCVIRPSTKHWVNFPLIPQFSLGWGRKTPFGHSSCLVHTWVSGEVES